MTLRSICSSKIHRATVTGELPAQCGDDADSHRPFRIPNRPWMPPDAPPVTQGVRVQLHPSLRTRQGAEVAPAGAGSADAESADDGATASGVTFRRPEKNCSPRARAARCQTHGGTRSERPGGSGLGR